MPALEKRNPSTWMEQRGLDKGPVVAAPALSLMAGRGAGPCVPHHPKVRQLRGDTAHPTDTS